MPFAAKISAQLAESIRALKSVSKFVRFDKAELLWLVRAFTILSKQTALIIRLVSLALIAIRLAFLAESKASAKFLLRLFSADLSKESILEFNKTVLLFA